MCGPYLNTWHDDMKLHRSLTVWYIYIPHYITNLPHIVYAYRLVSVLSIHCYCCNLNENCFWTQSQRKLRFPPLLNVIKTSKETSQLLKYHIKPPSTHFPVCRLHFSLGSVHPISMHPWHLPEVISHVGWGSWQSKFLVQPRKRYFTLVSPLSVLQIVVVTKGNQR